MTILKSAAIAALTLCATAGSALAHATLEQKEAAIGTTTKVTLRVPHGCKGEATHTVRIEIPEGLYAVKPMPKPGWDLAIETGAYATPYDNHGTQMTEGPKVVTWSGGHLEDAWYDEFTVRGTVGPNMEPGTVLFFPSLQTCANGVADWTDTSGSHDVPNPAPKLTLVAGAGGADHGHGMAMAPVTLGALELSGPFTISTLPNQPVAGGFVTISNTGAEGDVLVGASSPVAGEMQIHEMKMEDGVMKMRELPGGLPIQAHETVNLKPGGYHVMFMDLKQPLVAGEEVEVTLDFAKAGKVSMTFPVKDRKDVKSGGHGNHAGHGSN
ncbi:DUF1775 domain-containing protein [Chachezhania sediminis]|uniref:DUF1775 domain-containing protein n=1 Tax=Chachezhania sediminis TaxID=2599291 RepID=UPI00131DE010|nr:DUF1775 domain-containing protein [Chachezhania sediminis]